MNKSTEDNCYAWQCAAILMSVRLCPAGRYLLTGFTNPDVQKGAGNAVFKIPLRIYDTQSAKGREGFGSVSSHGISTHVVRDGSVGNMVNTSRTSSSSCRSDGNETFTHLVDFSIDASLNLALWSQLAGGGFYACSQAGDVVWYHHALPSHSTDLPVEGAVLRDV